MKSGDEFQGSSGDPRNNHGLAASRVSDTGLSLDEYHALLSIGPGVHYMCGADGDFAALFIDPCVTAQFGYAPEEFTNDPGFWASHIHPDDLARVFRDLEAVFTQDFHQHEYRFLHQDGGYRWVSDELRLLRDSAGEPVKIVGQWIDITLQIEERKTGEFFERGFNALAEGAIEGILVHQDFKPLFANQALADIYGYTIEEIMAMPSLIELIAPHDRDRLSGFSAARARGETPPEDYEQQGIRKDGSIIWLRNMARRIGWDGQDAIQSVVVDITRQKLLETELRDNQARLTESEARLRTILDNAPIAIYMKDAAGRYIFSNRQNAEWYGVDAVEAIGRTTADYFPPDYAEVAAAWDERATDGRETIVHEVDIPKRDNQMQHGLVFRVPVVDSKGDFFGVLGMNLDLSERRQAEQALKESEQRFRDFAEIASDSFWEMDENLRFSFTTLMRDAVHDTSNDIIGKTRWEAVGIDPAADPHWRAHKETLEQHKPFRNFIYTPTDKDGLRRHISISGSPLFDAEKEFAGYRGVAVDMTELYRSQEALLENEQRLQSIIDNSPSAIFLKDADARYLLVNKAFAAWYDLEPAELIGKTTFDVFPKDLAVKFTDIDQKVLEEGITSERDAEVPMAGGESRIVRFTKFPVRNSQGLITGIGVIGTDVTVYKQAERALKESERRVRDFAEATSDWFWETDAGNKLTHLSGSSSGWDDTMIRDRIGRSRFDFEEFDGTPEKWSRHRRALASRESFRDFRYKRSAPDGRILHASISGRPFFDLDGNFQGYRGTGMDITAEIEARTQLADAIDSMADGVIIFDAEERLVACNQRYREEYPLIADLVEPGAGFEMLIRAAADRGMIAEAVGRENEWIDGRLSAFHENESLFEQQLADGRWMQIAERKTPNGYTVSVRTDITELKQREGQLRQAQRLESIGQLTGGVAHDFNNMLTAVIGNLELIKDRGIEDERDRISVDIALRASFRGAELTRRLLAFARQQELDAKITQINELLPHFCQLAQRTISEDITIEMKLAAELWPSKIDPGELENALLNLVINARDAMPGGGRLTIETANRVVEGEPVAGFEELSPGSYVVVTVSDSGNGMSKEVQERVFEPFFTTKEAGKGSGLGLSMVFGFAKQSGGHVSVYSEEGMGTAVKIYLPSVEDAGNGESPVAETENSNRSVAKRSWW